MKKGKEKKRKDYATYAVVLYTGDKCVKQLCSVHQERSGYIFSHCISLK